MGFWELKNGKMIEMIFDEDGNFIKFGGILTEKEIEEIKKEINITLKEDNII